MHIPAFHMNLNRCWLGSDSACGHYLLVTRTACARPTRSPTQVEVASDLNRVYPPPPPPDSDNRTGARILNNLNFQSFCRCATISGVTVPACETCGARALRPSPQVANDTQAKNRHSSRH